MIEEEEITQQTAQEGGTPIAAPQEDLQKQLEEMKDKYLRTLAESENIRRRLAKEKQETLRFGIENVICEFLPAIDQFENALRFADTASGEVRNWALGFRMILGQFEEVLKNYGITTFLSSGALFDPNCHEAVESIETEETPDGTIVQEFTKGYKSALRTIRPARVKVAKALKQNSPQSGEKNPISATAEQETKKGE